MGQLPPNYCTYNFGNSSFNLLPLRLDVGQMWYLEDDRNNEGSQNYTYIFNVCDDVFFPKWFPNTGDCATTYPGPGQYPSQPNTGNASAYQLSNFPVPNGDKCHKLGGSLRKDPTQMTWGLYDTANPATGVVVQFKGGDACPGTFPARTRSMRLWLNCYNDEGAIPGKETVLESETCTYDIFVNSALGCPAECPRVPTADGSKSYICSRHGVCDFDAEARNARCFCNEGWTGNDCSQPAGPAPSGLSATGAVLLTVSLLLIGTLAFLVYLWRRIRGLRLDPSAYGSLRGGEEGEAMN